MIINQPFNQMIESCHSRKVILTKLQNREGAFQCNMNILLQIMFVHLNCSQIKGFSLVMSVEIIHYSRTEYKLKTKQTKKKEERMLWNFQLLAIFEIHHMNKIPLCNSHSTINYSNLKSQPIIHVHKYKHTHKLSELPVYFSKFKSYGESLSTFR